MALKRKSNIKKNIVLSFTFVAVIPVIILSVALFIHTVKTFEQTRKYNEHIQNQIAYNVQSVISESRKLLTTLRSSDTLSYLSSLTKEDNLYTDAIVADALLQFSDLSYYFNHIDNYYLYLQNADAVLSSQGILDSATYYLVNSSEIGMPYSTWITKLNEKSLKDIYETNKTSVQCYHNLLRGLPLDISSVGATTLVVSIPQDSFFYGIEENTWIPYSSTYLFDLNGSFLFGRSNNKESIEPITYNELINEKSTRKNTIFSTEVSFETISWTLVSVASIFHVFKTPLLLFMATVLSLILSIVLASLAVKSLSKKNYTPIEKLTALLEEDGEKAQYDTLINSVQKIIVENNTYADDINAQRSAYKRLLLSQLLNGSLSTSLTTTLASYGISFPYEKHFVMAFSTDSSESGSLFTQTNSLLENIEKVIFSFFQKKNARIYTTYENNQIYAICNFSDNSFSLENFVHLIESDFNNLCLSYNISLAVGISKLHSNLSRISASYLESIEALSSSVVNQQFITLYTDISDENKNFFTMKQENSLLSYLQSGDSENAVNLLKEILDNSAPAKRSNRDYILYDIVCMFLKFRYMVNFSENDELTELLTFPSFYANMNSIEEFLPFATMVSEKICNHINSQKVSSTHQLAQKAADIISSNYSDQSLSVDEIAKRLHCSTSHITKTFKSHFGVSVYEYLQKIRIEEAKNLLKTDMSISKVLLSVGYNNQRTFNRVFKSMENVSPTEYRRLLSK